MMVGIDSDEMKSVFVPWESDHQWSSFVGVFWLSVCLFVLVCLFFVFVFSPNACVPKEGVQISE